jgi:hypothetical protein
MLIPLEIVAAIGTAFEATDDDRALTEVNVVPAEVAGLGHPKAVPIDQQADQPIAVAVPVALEGREKLIDLGLGQVLSHPVVDVRFTPLRANWSHFNRFSRSDHPQLCWHFETRSPVTDRIILESDQ